MYTNCNPKYERIRSFTGLRFFMIMTIVCSHFEFLDNFNKTGIIYTRYFHNPTFAVDFFFLLSGFGMMLSNYNNASFTEVTFPSFKYCIKYCIRHVKKIYPVYLGTVLFGLICNILIAIITGRNLDDFFIKEIIKLLVNLPLLQAATGMSIFTHAFNGVSWFLSSLFCIYLISPVLIFFYRKTAINLKINTIYFCTNIILTIVSFILFSLVEQKNVLFDILAYGSPYRRVFYVMIGMNIATYYTILKNNYFLNGSKIFNLLEIISILLVTIFFFIRNTLCLYINNITILLMDIILCSFFIFVFSFDKGCVSQILKIKMFQDLGNMSMYIFIVHYPIRIYLEKFIKLVTPITPLLTIIEIFFILLSTLLISILLYKRIDKRRKLLN